MASVYKHLTELLAAGKSAYQAHCERLVSILLIFYTGVFHTEDLDLHRN